MISKFIRSAVVTVFSIAALAIFAATLHAQSTYSVITKWTVGGEGGWDYLAVDPAAPHLFITHGTRVEIVDTGSGKVVGAITGLKGTHGVVFDDADKFGYISDGHANEVVVFDRKSFEKVGAIAAGTNPDGMVFDPKSKTVWAFNGRSKNATVIDGATQKVIATIALPGKPEFPVSDGAGYVYVNIEDKNLIVKLDVAEKKIVATWPLEGLESPSGQAIDIAGHRLFSVCDGGKMAVTDAATGKRLATPTIGDGPDAAGYDAKNKLAFSSNGDGTLTIIDAGKPGYPVLQTVKTQRGARTMAFDAANGRVYLVTAEFGPAPAATAEQPHPRPAVLPGSFSVLVVGTK
jgi:DNA-binding beta-propeller fold protein YncE